MARSKTYQRKDDWVLSWHKQVFMEKIRVEYNRRIADPRTPCSSYYTTHLRLALLLWRLNVTPK